MNESMYGSYWNMVDFFHDFPGSHVSELRGVTFVFMGRALDPLETHNFDILSAI